MCIRDSKYGRKNIYMFSLILGGLGLISMIFIQDKNLLLIPMVGVGISWAAILALPYAIPVSYTHLDVYKRQILTKVIL